MAALRKSHTDQCLRITQRSSEPTAPAYSRQHSIDLPIRFLVSHVRALVAVMHLAMIPYNLHPPDHLANGEEAKQLGQYNASAR